MISSEDLNRAATRMESAAQRAELAAERIEEAVRRLAILTDNGYGNNVCRLIELLEQQEPKP